MSATLLFPLSQTSKIPQKRCRFVLIVFLLISTASTVSSNSFQSKQRHSPSIRFKAHDIILLQYASKHTTSFIILLQSVSSTRVWAYALSFYFLSTAPLQLQNPNYRTPKLQNLNWFLKVQCITPKLKKPDWFFNVSFNLYVGFRIR